MLSRPLSFALAVGSGAVLWVGMAGCGGGDSTPAEVQQPKATISLSSPSTTVTTGLTLQIHATVQPATASQAVTWSSSDPTIAAVDQAGLVLGVAAGTVTITATSRSDPSVHASVTISVSDPDANPDPDPDPDPSADTYCGQLGYPCTLGEVDSSVVARGDALLHDLGVRIDGGESNESAASWLSAQDGVASVESSASGVAFRLTGGRPVWFLTPPDDGAASSPRLEPYVARSEDVVGHHTARDNLQNKKKALLLAPFLFQLGSTDPTPQIQSMLQGVRDYAGGVTVIGNPSEPSLPSGPGIPAASNAAGAPTVADFMGWDAYDLIVVATHGFQLATDPVLHECTHTILTFLCISAIFTGERAPNCGVIKAKYKDVPGVTCGHPPNDTAVVYAVLDTDFFTWRYGGLNKAIVYFHACSGYQNGSLAYALGGDTGEFFGWDDTVDRYEAFPSAVRLFQLMIHDGLTTVEAYDKLESEGGTTTSTATLQLYSHGDGLHIREITRLKNPMDPAVSQLRLGSLAPSAGGVVALPSNVDEQGNLESGNVIPFLGLAGDGHNDELFFYVDVDGVDAGRESDFDVTVSVNGTQLGTWPLTGPDATRVDEYTVRRKIRQPLDFDVQQGQVIDLKATANLPGGDAESHDEASVVLSNPTLHIHSTVSSSGDGVTSTSEVDGDVDVKFKAGANPDDIEFDMSAGDLKYVRFEITAAVPAGCSLTTQTFDGHLEIRKGMMAADALQTGTFGVPESLDISPLPEIREVVTYTCAGGSYSYGLINWYATFSAFHGGAIDGMNELDPTLGYVVTGWTPGTGTVLARKIYDRSGQQDQTTFAEQTTLELRGPSYNPTAAAHAATAGRVP